MKPNFALSLSFEGIDLLFRAPDGWRTLGHASFEDPDLSAALNDLREQSEQLPDAVLATKLILPENQVKFIAIPLKGLRPSQYRMAAENALDGTTPYPLQDLAIDWQAKDNQLHIAAVAKETLAEAEAFAKENAFNPVSFTAQSTGDFPGEPFFGATDTAVSVLGSAVEPDIEATNVIGPMLVASTEPTTNIAQPPQIEEIHAPQLTPVDANHPTAPTNEQPQGTDYAQLALDIEDELSPAVPLSAEELEIAKNAETGIDTAPAPDADPLPPAADLFSTAAAADLTPDAGLPDDLPEAAKLPPVSAAESKDMEPKDAGATRLEPEKSTDTPSADTGFSFASVRAPRDHASDANPPALNGVSRGTDVFEGVRKLTLRPDQETAAPPAPALEQTTKGAPTDPIAMAASLAPKSADLATISGDLATPSNVPEGADHAPTAPDTASEGKSPKPDNAANSVFAASKGAQQVGGKPRYLGLSLMALLLMGFVVAFGWSFLSENDSTAVSTDSTAPTSATSGTEDSITDAAPAEVALPNVEGTALTPAPDTAEMVDLPPELQYEPEAPADETGTTARPKEDGEGPDTLRAETPSTPTGTPSDAPVEISTAERYAASGIWQDAPTTPEAPATTALDDLYIASIDPAVSAFDAVALPDSRRVRSDITPPAQSLPAAAGTTFSFDQRGLVTATVDGALTPDGILIYKGPPPLRPRDIPERVVPVANDAVAISPEELARRAKVRPKARPTDLIEENERSQLGGRTRNELANLRPKQRPEGLTAAIIQANAGAAGDLDLLNSASQPLIDLSGDTRDAINSAVAQSVGASSLKPKLRPTNLDTDLGGSTQVASAARAQPQLPSSASVARQATVKNQLNLRKVNLIGVTGKSGARKALVRLKNGRIKTVSIGDRLDGGRVKAIDKDALHYTRSGRTVVLKMPKS